MQTDLVVLVSEQVSVAENRYRGCNYIEGPYMQVWAYLGKSINSTRPD